MYEAIKIPFCNLFLWWVLTHRYKLRFPLSLRKSLRIFSPLSRKRARGIVFGCAQAHATILRVRVTSVRFSSVICI